MPLQTRELDAKGAPFKASGRNDALLTPCKWHTLMADYAAGGVNFKKALHPEQLVQAKLDFLCWASASKLPFCQVR